MIIHGTPTYQISLIYRKRQKGYDSDISIIWPKGKRSKTKCGHVGTWHTHSWLYTYIPNIIDLSEETKKLDR